MKSAWPCAIAATALAVPSFAAARPVALEARLADYGGSGAYVAIYVTDAKGAHQATLWVAGTKSKYWRHLRDWYKASGGRAKVDGVSGASVGAGQTLRATVEIADALLDAGYEIHVDTAVEDMAENPSEVVVPLTTGDGGKAVAGKGYVASFRYTL
ncbi:DUF2271 domain-containing protein [Dokdonella fugitiva]|jgi:hypothetical protein|uniref:DUF2271 domain-containing protein n=1 Tax=Dokdonella fugitiva TaxID=328517 RepID=UPI0015FDAADA|nr:DUF2271 domain-containing protein [Dokdonella fugitiva]MBA8883731.1 hypothetical protein [Dokdonella fugitiva]